jgi:hypothetical protein
MARLNQPHATSVEQALRQEIAELERELSTLSRRTTATIQQAAPANIADPIEGQVIINHADGHKLYWYSNNAWHSVCDCAVAMMGPALYSTDVYSVASYGDQWALTIATAPGVYEYPFPVGEPDDPHHRTRPVWNPTFDKIAFTEIEKWYFGVPTPQKARLRIVNRDGTNAVTIAEKLIDGSSDFQHFDFYTFSRDGTRIAYLTWQPGSYTVLRVANVDGSGTPVDLTAGASAYAYQRPMWGLNDEYVYYSGFPDGAGGYGLYRVKADGSDSPTAIWIGNGADPFDLNQQGTEFCAVFYGVNSGLIFVSIDGATITNLAMVDFPWETTEEPLGAYYTPDGEWILCGGQPDLEGDTFPREDIMALKRSDFSTYKRFTFGPNSQAGEPTTNPPYAGNAFTDSYSCGEVNGALHIFTQYVNYAPEQPGSSSGIAAYPFDDPTAGFWLADDVLDPIGEVDGHDGTGGRYYVTGLPHMTNPLIGSFDQ